MSADPFVRVSRHPLLLHRLGLLRDTATPPLFRRLVRDLAQLLFWEAAHDLRLEATIVTTPLAACRAERLADRIATRSSA